MISLTFCSAIVSYKSADNVSQKEKCKKEGGAQASAQKENWNWGMVFQGLGECKDISEALDLNPLKCGDLLPPSSQNINMDSKIIDLQ